MSTIDPNRAAPAPVTASTFRRACGQFATGVAVVTVRDRAGARGMTANSFVSVSLDPPLVLVSIDRRNRTHQLLCRSRRFAVSILAAAQREWSDRFAGRRGDVQDRFDDIPHRLTGDGLPVLEGALASLVCSVVAVHPAGDHSLFIAQVEQIEATPGAAPLVYFASGYREVHGPASDADGPGRSAGP